MRKMANNRVHVLIVDDSVTIRAMMESVLNNDSGIKVIGEVSCAEEAAQILRDSSPDVTLLDIQMPGMNGLDFLDEIKAWHAKPVIMLSSLSAPGAPERIEALRRGAVGSFNKAKAVSEAPKLIKMIKDAAHGKLRADSEDAKVLAAIIAAENAAHQAGGVSA
jgi:two-component system chemotaxis response regulator CheB